MPEMVFDLPLGGGHIVQRTRGCSATLADGGIDGRDTGARPGRPIRSADAPAA